MALIDEVRTRISSDQLNRITNPNDPDGANAGEGTTKLTAACSDVAAMFKIHAEIEFDITNDVHLQHAVEGVEKLLIKRMSQGNGDSDFDRWIELFDKIRKTENRKRVELGSDSFLQPTQPGNDGRTVRPWSDPLNFSRVNPDGPTQNDPNYWSRDD